MKRPLLIIFLVLLIDQSFKFWIKTNMTISEQFPLLGEWFFIHFTENNGMAFGFELDGAYGKLILSLFRIAAVGGIGYYLWVLVKEKAPKGLIASIALILAGALGNIIDSAFYGLIFSESTYYEMAGFLPADGGYAPILHGKVVDMLWFPLMEGIFPDWFPIWGGEPYMFFRPVFNIADAAISVGVGMIIVFQRRYFVRPKTAPSAEEFAAASEALKGDSADDAVASPEAEAAATAANSTPEAPEVQPAAEEDSEPTP